MKAHFKEVDLHKIQLYKKKAKSNKKKMIHQRIHLKKKEKIQFNLIKGMMEKLWKWNQRKTN